MRGTVINMYRDHLTYPTACFIGESYESSGLTENGLKELLRPVIIDSTKEGYKTFITDMTIGFGIPAAEIVIEEAEKNEQLFLVCALSNDNFTKGWSAENKKRFKKIKDFANKISVTDKIYGKYRTLICRRHMINHSLRLITSFYGNDRDFSDIIEYANRESVEVVNISEKTKK